MSETLSMVAGETTASRRYVYFSLVDATDGITAETGEAGGQPQVSINGSAWSNTGVGTLVHIGNGHYYAELTESFVTGLAGSVVLTRYKSSNTAEARGSTVQLINTDIIGRQILLKDDVVIYEDDITDSVSATIVDLGTGAGNVDDQYNGCLISFYVSGGAVGLDRIIVDYDGTTRRATLDEALPFTPGAGWGYRIVPGRARLASTNHAGATVPTVTTLTNDPSGVTTLLSRLGAFTGSGVNTVLGFLRAMANKAAGIATPSDLSSSGTYSNTTDSLEAIKDSGAGGDPLTSEVPGAYAQGTAGYKLGTLALTGRVTVVSPVSTDGQEITIYKGDDYDADDGRALEWETEDSAEWPTLTSSTITFKAKLNDETFSKAGSVVTATGTNKKVRVELADTETSGLTRGRWDFEIEAELPSGNVVTLVRGAMDVLEDL